MKRISKRQVLLLHNKLIDIILQVASGQADYEELYDWVLNHE